MLVLKGVGSISGLGFTIAIPIVLGHYLDVYFNTGTTWTRIGVLLGVAAGIAGLISFVMILLKNRR
jgi:hypothetical protein